MKLEGLPERAGYRWRTTEATEIQPKTLNLLKNNFHVYEQLKMIKKGLEHLHTSLQAKRINQYKFL